MTVLVAMRFAKRFSRPSHKGDKLFKRFRLSREVVSLLDMTLTPESRTSGHARLQQIEPAVLGGVARATCSPKTLRTWVGSSPDCYSTGALEMIAMMDYFFDRRANSSGAKSSRELCG